MSLPRTFEHINLGVNTSLRTGSPYFVGDARQLTVSIETQTNTASLFTIFGSNENGFQSALGTANPTVNADGWSHITVIQLQGLYTIDPGFRWIMAGRPSASSATIIFAGRS